MQNEKDLSYLDSAGYTVFTSTYLGKRGTCCRSACLHCPYGFTLKKHGVQFRTVELEDHSLVEEIISQSGSAAVDWAAFLPENCKLVILKEQVCGLILKNHIVIKHVYLLPHFQNQGLSKEMLESYYFI